VYIRLQLSSLLAFIAGGTAAAHLLALRPLKGADEDARSLSTKSNKATAVSAVETQELPTRRLTVR
jgi:hypothetical protein